MHAFLKESTRAEGGEGWSKGGVKEKSRYTLTGVMIRSVRLISRDELQAGRDSDRSDPRQPAGQKPR